MDAACIAWDTALPFPSRPFVSLLFLPPLPTHPTPLSPPAHSSGACLFLPVAVLLQLSPLLWFCFVACCAWWCLLFCVPGLGSCVLSPPRLPPLPFFVRPACCVLPLLVLCLCCVVLRFPVVCCGWLSLFPSLLSPPPACVCVKPVITYGFLYTSSRIAGGQRGLAKLCPTKLFASIPGSTD